MFIVDGTTIDLTRGDTFLAEVTLYENGAPYVPQEGDVITFRAKHSAMTMSGSRFLDDNVVIEKDVPTDTMLLRLEPEDTSGLKFGRYAYNLYLIKANGMKDTFIANGVLNLTAEV